MESVGIDLHQNYAQIAVLTEAGEILEKRVRTSRSALSAFFVGRPESRVLLESSTESEWVARLLEELGQQVVVANPGYAAMYAYRSPRVKTDRRDARALAEACRQGVYRPAHRLSANARSVRALVRGRQELVRTRTRFILRIRSLLRQDGLGIPPGATPTFARRLTSVPVSATLREAIQPFLDLIGPINEQLAEADRKLGEFARADPIMRRLCTVPGVGPVTAASFVCTIDQVERFSSARAVRCYLGLVPCEASSGERLRRGPITKAGNTWMRATLIQAAWAVLRSTNPSASELQSWARSIACRRGRLKAVVALARKLAGILFAVWRDGTVFEHRVSTVPTVQPA